MVKSFLGDCIWSYEQMADFLGPWMNSYCSSSGGWDRGKGADSRWNPSENSAEQWRKACFLSVFHALLVLVK